MWVGAWERNWSYGKVLGKKLELWAGPWEESQSCW